MTEIPRDLPVAVIASQLGLPKRGRRWACPACRVEVDSSKRRGPVQAVGPRWVCYACGAKGDAITMIALVTTGEPRPRGSGFKPVIDWLESRQHVDFEAVKGPELPRAPADELSALLRSCSRPADDQRVRRFLHERSIDPTACPGGVLPRADHPVYRQIGKWWPRWWSDLYRLVVPAFTGAGRLGGMHARDVTGKADRKATWPAGVDCSGLLFADPVYARPLLRGSPPRDLSRVLLVEGITDYLTAGAHRVPGLAVLGIESGSAAALRLIRFPPGVRIYVGTDPDIAGDAYAEAIAAAISPRAAYRLPLHRLAT